jgi:WD40 repeat protein
MEPYMPKIPIIQSSNVANLVELRTLQPRTGAVNSLAFSPDSSILALGCSDDKIELWRVNDGALLSTLPFGWPGAEGVAFHPNGNTIVGVSGNSPKFSLWDATRKTKIKDVSVPIGHQPGCVAITPSGQTIATGGFDGKVLIWDWRNGDPMLRSALPAHPSFVTSIAFSPDGLYLATGSDDGLRLWRVGFDLVPQLHAEVLVTSGSFRQLSFNGLGTMLAAANWDGKLYIVNVGDGHTIVKLSEPLSASNEQMFAGAFAPTEQLIASCQSSAPIASAFLEFWDASTQTLLLAKPLLCDKVQFAPNGRVLAVIRDSPGRPDIPAIWGLPRRPIHSK